jgi:hypothetical protein
LFAWASLVLMNARIGGANAMLLGAYGVAFGVSIVLSGRWRGIELTPEGAFLRRNRKRFIPWSDVTEVRHGSLLLTRIVVFETVQGPVRSWAPAASPLAPDRDFAAKLAYIRQWWWKFRPGASDSPMLWPTAGATGWGIPVVHPSPTDSRAARIGPPDSRESVRCGRLRLRKHPALLIGAYAYRRTHSAPV